MIVLSEDLAYSFNRDGSVTFYWADTLRMIARLYDTFRAGGWCDYHGLDMDKMTQIDPR